MKAATGRIKNKDTDPNNIVKKAPIIKSSASQSTSNNKITQLKTLIVENQDIEQIKNLIRKNPSKCAEFLKILPKKLIDRIVNEVRNVILQHPELCAEIIKSLPSDKIHHFTEAIKKSISAETCIDIIKALPNNQLHHYKNEVKEVIKTSPEKYLRLIKALPKGKQNTFLPLINDLAKHIEQSPAKPIKKIAHSSEIITKIKNIISDQTKSEAKTQKPIIKTENKIKHIEISQVKQLPQKIVESKKIQTQKIPNLNSTVKMPKELRPKKSIETLKKESFVEKTKKQQTNSSDHPLNTTA